MLKTTWIGVPVDEAMHETIRRLAYQQRTSKAEVFRTALTEYAKRASTPKAKAK